MRRKQGQRQTRKKEKERLALPGLAWAFEKGSAARAGTDVIGSGVFIALISIPSCHMWMEERERGPRYQEVQRRKAGVTTYVSVNVDAGSEA